MRVFAPVIKAAGDWQVNTNTHSNAFATEFSRQEDNSVAISYAKIVKTEVGLYTRQENVVCGVDPYVGSPIITDIPAMSLFYMGESYRYH